jgi:hypothetical protein
VGHTALGDIVRFSALLGGLFAIAFVSAAAAADQWTTFSDPTEAFRLDVPQQPVVSNDSTTNSRGKVIQSIKYMIDHNTSAMLAMVGDYRGWNLDPDSAIASAVQGVQSNGRTLLNDTAVVIDGHAGHDLKLVDTAGDSLTDRIFFFDDHLYQVITVLTPGATPDDRETVARYAGSLHFLR